MTSGPLLRLVLGDQLNPQHSWFTEVRPDVVYLFMEMRQETDYVLHHAQKVIAIFAGMRDLARHLRQAGHRVRYVAIDDPSNRQTLEGNLDALLAHYHPQAFEYQAPDEWRLDAQLRGWCARQALPTRMVDSEHFLTSRDEALQIFGDRPHWLMERFYRVQRARHSVLLDGQGKPQGGRWNFDEDNRKPWRGSPAEPPDTRSAHDHGELWQTITGSSVKALGEPCAESFRWPLNRAEALSQLDAFITHALPSFGAYQDAMSGRSWRLFHSLLSFALNTKMLRPMEVIRRAEAAWHAGDAPLASVEGFVRQILGWREYVRGVYWAHMPGYTESNVLGHVRPLPAWFWTGHTRMACMAQAIGQSLQHAYAHHIQRLMVIGNFALLAGLDPQSLHRWYLGIYIDAFEWVEAPNTLGMSQFADGGRVATKPYVSAAAYLHRMGDHCGACPYNRQQRTGPDACPFNALYWDFIARHPQVFEGNPRMAWSSHQWQKMSNDDQVAVRQQAAHWLERLDGL